MTVGNGETEVLPVVGQPYKGGVVVSINEEKSTRPNGVIRTRRMIELSNGMILLEDSFEDPRKIEGEYKELEYKEVPSPSLSIKPRAVASHKKKKPKIPNLQDSDHSLRSKDSRDSKEDVAALKEAEEKAREKEKQALKAAQELAKQKEAELQARKEEEARKAQEEKERQLELERQRLAEEEAERRRLEEEAKAEEERKRREEEAKAEEERKRREAIQAERLKASQEAALRRKEEADKRREAERQAKAEKERKARIREKWTPQTVCVQAPESKQPRKDGTPSSADPQALWKFGDGSKADPDMDWWMPQDVVIHPPGKEIPAKEKDGSVPHGYWGYAPGTEPDEDAEDWNPSGSSGQKKPKIWVLAPGEKPPTDGSFKVQGEWSMPPGETAFPPLPTPKNTWEPKEIMVHPKSKPCAKDTDDNVVHGVWKVYEGGECDDLGDDDWGVAEIKVYPQGKAPTDLGADNQHGVWGLAPGAKPDDNGQWKPDDIWLFGPGNAPPENEWSPQGVWTISPSAEHQQWPPKAPRNANAENWKPSTMWAHSPASNLPRKDGSSPSDGPKAIWKYGTLPEDPNFNWWMPQQVVIHPPGKPIPVEMKKANDTTPRGVWGYAPGTAPDDDAEEWNPSGGLVEPEFWLFPPGDKPAEGSGVKVQGEWSYPEGETGFPPLGLPKNQWEPRSVVVHPKSKPCSNEANEDNDIHGVWKVYEGGAYDDMGDDDWRVAELQVYPEGQEPKNLDDNVVHGVWGLAPGAQPNDDGEWNANDIWFFGPGNEPDDEEWNPQGIWTHTPESTRQDFPPMSEPADEWAPQAIWVYPPNHVPAEDEEWNPSGVWCSGGDGGNDDDEDWSAKQVMIHPAGQEPENLEDYPVHGVWGLSPGAQRDDDGNWNPSDVWFIGAGEEPPEDWKPQGVWTIAPGPEKPKEGTMVNVYPAANAPESADDSNPSGVWKFGDGTDADPDWAPMGLMMYEEGNEPKDLDDSIQHGVYGYGPGAKPDEDGNYDPSGLWFILPGETPPDDDDWCPMGTWTAPPGKVDNPIPIPKKHVSVPRDVGKLPPSPAIIPKKKTPTDAPRNVWVFPKKKAPKEIEHGVDKGVWSYTPGKKVMDAGKKPTQVQLYDKGQEPKELPRHHGAWGYAPGAVPNADGEYLPEDLWLFAPGETPPGDDEWQPQGTWVEPEKPKSPTKSARSSPTKGMTEKAEDTGPKKRERNYKGSVWVHPCKDVAPAVGEEGNPQGCWSHCPGGDGEKEPQELLVYAKDAHIENLDRLPHGIFGYAAGAKPDANGLWSPKDMVFYPPFTDPPPDLQEPGIWTYPHGSRIEIETSYKYEGELLRRFRKTSVFFMDTVTSFEIETTGQK